MAKLHEDLLAQASLLATLEATRPKQASLRRAVSAAYYAYFHYLIDAVAAQTTGSNIALRRRVGRSFSHSNLKENCAQISAAHRGSWHQPAAAVAELFKLPLEPEIAIAADAFVQLQQARHAADYDLSKPLNRLDVQRSIEQSETAIAGLRRVRQRSNFSAFLAALAFAKQWNRPA